MFRINNNNDVEEKPKGRNTQRKTKADDIDTMVMNLKAAMEARAGEKWNWRRLENFICKIYRVCTGNCEMEAATTGMKRKRKVNADKIYFDIYFKQTNLYTIEEKGVNVEFADGENKLFTNGLLPSFHWKGKAVSWDEFICNNSTVQVSSSLIEELCTVQFKMEPPALENLIQVARSYNYSRWLESRLRTVENES